MRQPADETLDELRKLGLDHDAIDERITVQQRKIMEEEAHVQLHPGQSNLAHDSY